MNKRIFGLAIIGILAGVLIVNIIQDERAKNEAKQQMENMLTEADGYDAERILSQGAAKGDIPPDFELETLDGETVKLSDLSGKKVLLNFWASWCGPCKAEMPHMENFFKEKADQHNVEIIAVNMTQSEKIGDKREKVEKFREEYGLTFPILLDIDGDVERQYGIIAIPTTFFIGTNGVIQNKIVGPMDEEMMEKLVKELN